MTKFQALRAIDDNTAAVSGVYYLVQRRVWAGSYIAYHLVTRNGKTCVYVIDYAYLPERKWRMIPIQEWDRVRRSR